MLGGVQLKTIHGDGMDIILDKINTIDGIGACILS